ncbi:MAG: LON peptidase substrate-binding domain-containing protein [Candidatus Rokubacteria bacterium]|nr:LON peptidase substrate-binding domain-containing protein [Candidatus Rokubacteria bacterium]
MAQVYLPIFPLPDVTFFPHTLLPLHIFEPRYRAMITDCLARDKRLAVVGLEPGHEADYQGKPPVRRIGGAGEIVHWERLATGRYNILVRGRDRIAIEREMPTDTLYRMALVSRLGESGGDGARVPRLVEAVKARCRQVLEAVGRRRPDIDGLLSAPGPPGMLCDQIASAIVPYPAIRQALLEEVHVERRLAGLARALDELRKRVGGGGLP